MLQTRTAPGREDVIRFVRDQHVRSGKMPSIRAIVGGLGTSNSILYRMFPGGSEEMARLASVPSGTNLLRGFPSRKISNIRASIQKTNLAEYEARLEASRITTMVNTMTQSFLTRTKQLEGDPYWSGKRCYITEAALSAIELIGKADPYEAVHIERKFRDEVERLLTIASCARGLFRLSRRLRKPEDELEDGYYSFVRKDLPSLLTDSTARELGMTLGQFRDWNTRLPVSGDFDYPGS